MARIRAAFNIVAFTSSLCISLVLGGGIGTADANDLFAKTIPASMCQPAFSSALGRARITNGAWVFRGDNTGNIVLWCPLSINRALLGDPESQNRITDYRVYYRDTDGNSTTTQVTVQLISRTAQGMQTIGDVFSSNDFNDSSNTAHIESSPNHAVRDRLYAFEVILTRTSTNQNPAFSGIDFLLPEVE